MTCSGQFPCFWLVSDADLTKTHISSPNKNGRYILKKGRKIAYDIAQRDYERKVIACAATWSKWLGKIIQTFPQEDLKDVYAKSKRRKPLLNPYELPDEEFVKNWESVQYEGKGFSEHDPEIITEKGEHVRSKSEKMIAVQKLLDRCCKQ